MFVYYLASGVWESRFNIVEGRSMCCKVLFLTMEQKSRFVPRMAGDSVIINVNNFFVNVLKVFLH